jgi:hypothetical protein
MRDSDALLRLRSLGFPIPSVEQYKRMKQSPRLFDVSGLVIPEPQPVERLPGEIRRRGRASTGICSRSIVKRAIESAGAERSLMGAPVSQLFQDIVCDIEPFMLQAKYRFMRPRPCQLGYMLAINEARFPVEHESPSYPSGRVFYAYLLHHIARRQGDTLVALRLWEFARVVERSVVEHRENYTSDCFVSRELAKQVALRFVADRVSRGVSVDDECIR